MRNPRLGVVVPYRRRPHHLNTFLPNISRYLSGQGIDYKIIVVDQDDSKDFNRGMLCNIGFQEAEKNACRYVVFHDVDMIPINVDYTYSTYPVHLISNDLPFETYFGGITLFPSNVFKKINGFSNFYWGWGFEDDDLRYRCIKNKVKLNKIKHTSKYANRDTVILNGKTSFIRAKNVLNHIRSFEIEIDIRPGKFIYDHEKTSDKYTIFSIPGIMYGGKYFDFTLFYTSFKRFSLQFYDKKEQFYQIYSEPIDVIENNIKIKFNAGQRVMELIIDNQTIGKIEVKDRLFEYDNARNITIGCDSNKENYFEGAIDSFSIKDRWDEYSLKYNSDNLEHYKLVDESKNGNNGRIIKAEIGKFDTPETYNNYIPIRRKSNVSKLSHESSGFIGGRWKSDLTRWNQLRFNNEVINDRYEGIEDGLSTCEYILHSKEKKGNIIHLKVGI